jgi:hypothetical protein
LLGLLGLTELRWSRGTAVDRLADRHDNFSCNGAHMQSRGTGLSDLFLNQRGALGDIHAAVCLMRLAPDDQAISKVPSRGAR